MEDFLNEISLVSDIEEAKDNKDVITLMTVHAAKGLEFDYIFLVGMDEGIFPHNRSLSSDDELEEERRLCYVAVTRAKKKLFITSTVRRMLYGLDMQSPKSRFISEISDEYIDTEKTKNSKKEKATIDKNATYTLGEKINHIEFGEGVIVGIDKNILTIAFKFPHGIKKLIKGHSSIKK